MEVYKLEDIHWQVGYNACPLPSLHIQPSWYVRRALRRVHVSAIISNYLSYLFSDTLPAVYVSAQEISATSQHSFGTIKSKENRRNTSGTRAALWDKKLQNCKPQLTGWKVHTHIYDHQRSQVKHASRAGFSCSNFLLFPLLDNYVIQFQNFILQAPAPLDDPGPLRRGRWPGPIPPARGPLPTSPALDCPARVRRVDRPARSGAGSGAGVPGGAGRAGLAGQGANRAGSPGGGPRIFGTSWSRQFWGQTVRKGCRVGQQESHGRRYGWEGLHGLGYRWTYRPDCWSSRKEGGEVDVAGLRETMKENMKKW